MNVQSRASKDESGNQYGRLTVLKRSGSNARGDSLWLCLCACGNKSIVKGYNLRKGTTSSCGCLQTGSIRKSIVGEKFNRLLVTKFVMMDKWRTALYECLCDCGQTKITSMRALKTNGVKSCGCLKQEVDTNRCGPNNPNWNSKRSDEERLVGRNITDYNHWSLRVKQRDGFVCKVCRESKSGQLVSHHLYNYHDFPELRTELSNGVCLCNDCHLKFHNIYGRRHNSPKQLLEFIENE